MSFISAVSLVSLWSVVLAFISDTCMDVCAFSYVLMIMLSSKLNSLCSPLSKYLCVNVLPKQVFIPSGHGNLKTIASGILKEYS